jgi:hypothetical protein
MRNGGSPYTPAPIILGENTDLTIVANMFHDLTPSAFRALSDPARASLTRDNWFPHPRGPRSSTPPRSRGSRP